MPREIDDHQIQELLDQGVSERAIARQLNIPRSTLKGHIQKLKGTPEGVHNEVHTAELPPDLEELLTWWRERKQLVQRTQAPADPERETERKTYHVQRRFIKAIERASDLEHVNIATMVNRIFAQYFQAEV